MTDYLETPSCERGRWLAGSHWLRRGAWGWVMASPERVGQRSRQWMSGTPFFSGLFPAIPEQQRCEPLFPVLCFLLILIFFFGFISLKNTALWGPVFNRLSLLSVLLSPPNPAHPQPQSHRFHRATWGKGGRKMRVSRNCCSHFRQNPSQIGAHLGLWSRFSMLNGDKPQVEVPFPHSRLFLLSESLRCMLLPLAAYSTCTLASACLHFQDLATAGIYIPPTYTSPPIPWPMNPLISHRVAHPHLPIPCHCGYYLRLYLPVFSSSRSQIQD